MEYNRYVEQWQQAVASRGAELGNAGVDGKFGPDTLKASLSIIDEDEESKAKHAKTAICIANSYVNVRSGRGGDYRRYDDIGNIYNGEIVKVLDEDLNEEYVKIAWRGSIGYAYNAAGKYFRFVDKNDIKMDERVVDFLR